MSIKLDYKSRSSVVAETSSQLFLNLLGLQQVSETSSRIHLVAATSPRPTGVLKSLLRVSEKIEHV